MDYSIGDKVSLIIGRPTILGVQVYIGDDRRTMGGREAEKTITQTKISNLKFRF